MKKYILLTWLFTISIVFLYAQTSNVLPSKSQLKWANSEIGVLIHYDINIFAKGGADAVDLAKKETLPPLSAFNPSKLNTDQWIETAKKAGAKYAVLVAKHGTGFTLWPSKANDYNIGNTPFKNGKGDILGDFIKSCKKYDIKPGIYYNTNYNSYFGAGYTKLPDDQTLKYNQMVYQQLHEIWTKYGTLFEIWFDGGVMTDKKLGISDKVSTLLRKYQPNAILFQGPLSENNLIRWVGNEEGHAPYPNWSKADANTSATGTVEIPNLNGNPDGKYWIPGETDFPNRKNGGWMWDADGSKQPPFSADELLDRYYTSVGRNANMLIGMVIDTAGLFPEHDSQIFVEFGKKLNARTQSMIGTTDGKGNIFTIKLEAAKEINQIEIQEDISKGERVRSYNIEGLVEGKWNKLCDGTSVGHKRIQLFDKVKVTEIRLTIVKSEGEPIIRKFSVYKY